MKSGAFWVFFVFVFAFSLTGCAKKVGHPPWFFKVSSMGPHLGPEEIIKLPEGDPIPFSQLLEDLRPFRVIFVGETHDQREHHQAQVRILQALIAEGKDVVLAMEMFQRTQQPVLDQWVQGNLTEEGFLKAAQWEATWGHDYSLYKPILDLVREHRVKVLGLNIPRELSRKVAQAGINRLSPEDRGSLPEMDLKDRDHRRYIRLFYDEHKEKTAKSFESFYQTQCLWDEAMAETIFNFLESPDGEGKTVLVFAGNGHVVFGFGVPKRLHRRASLPYRTIVLKEWKKEMDEDFFFTGTSEPLADYLWVTPPGRPGRKRPRIGITLKEREDPKGIWIERVMPESPAEKAGLLPGDQIVSIDGKEIESLKDLHDAVVNRGAGREITVTVIRNKERKEIIVTLPAPNKD